MLTAIFIVIAMLFGLVVGAYSHKWLAAVTGAPSNINSASQAGAALANAAVNAAHAVVDSAHDQAKAVLPPKAS